MPHKRATNTEPMDRILLWVVQPQGQCRSISTELYPDRHRGWPPHPSQRSGGRGTIIEEREVSWSRHIPAELVQAGGEDVITALTTICNKIWHTGEWPTPWTQSLVITLPKKGNLQQCQNYGTINLTSQSHAEDHTEQIEATSNEDHRRGTGKLQSRKEYHRADLQPAHSMWEISPAPARPLPCLHRLQKGLRQGLACSFVSNHEEVQHQHKPYPSHQKPL